MNIFGFGNNVELIIIMMMNPRIKHLLYSLPISSSFPMKLTMEASVIGDNLLSMKSDFTFGMLVNFNSDSNFKLKNGSNR